MKERPLSGRRTLNLEREMADSVGTPSASQALFDCHNLSVVLGEPKHASLILDNLDFTVQESKFLTIVGTSGTGKTTLLRVLGGLLAPTPESSVQFRGSPVSEPPPGVITVFQDYASSLLPWRTIERNVELGLEGRVTSAAVRKERVAEALAMVELTGRERDYPWQMSGGMQQRVQIARTLAVRPSVLLMDEPFGSLDAMTKATLQDELLAVHERTNTTIVFITHDIEEAIYLSDDIIVLAGSPGRISHRINVQLERPRDQIATREHPEYLRLRHVVHAALQSPEE